MNARAKGRQDKGEDITSSILTEAQVREIRANPPASQRGKRGGTEIDAYAKRYGVAKATIAAVIARRTWRHI